MPPAPANDNRPPEFDAAVMAYLPGLRRFASRLEHDREIAADLVTDTIAEAFEKYENYRGGDLWAWLRWQMRRVNNRGYVSRNRAPATVALDGADSATPASQEVCVDLSNVVSMLPGRDGVVALRHAMGDTYEEIAGDIGVTKQRVEQIVKREQRRVRQRCGLRVAA